MGQNDSGSTDEEETGSGSETGQLGTGARQIGATAVTVSVVIAVVITVVSAAVAVSSATTWNEPVRASHRRRH